MTSTLNIILENPTSLRSIFQGERLVFQQPKRLKTCDFKWQNDILTNIQHITFEDTDKQKQLNDFFNEEINEPIYQNNGIY